MTAPAPALQVRWRYHFLDFLTGNPLAVLPMSGVKLDDALNGAASGEGEIPLASPEAKAQDTDAATRPRRALCFAERRRIDPATRREVSSAVPWAGLVLGRTQTLGGRAVKLSMVTLPSYWQRRSVGDHSWTDVDPLDAQRTLLAEASACGWAGETPPVFAELTSPGASTNGEVLTTRDYLASDGTPALEAASRLADECGFDWRVVPYWDPVAGRFRVRLDQGYPRVGRIAPADLTWSAVNRSRYGFTIEGSLVEDGSQANNRWTALGEGSGETQLRAVAESTEERASGYPIYEGVLPSSNLSLRTPDAVQRHADGALAAGLASEVRIPGIKVRGDLEPDVSSYLVGDDVTVTVRDQLTGLPLTVVGQLVHRSVEPPDQNETELVTMDVQGTAP